MRIGQLAARKAALKNISLFPWDESISIRRQSADAATNVWMPVVEQLRDVLDSVADRLTELTPDSEPTDWAEIMDALESANGLLATEGS